MRSPTLALALAASTLFAGAAYAQTVQTSPDAVVATPGATPIEARPGVPAADRPAATGTVAPEMSPGTTSAPAGAGAGTSGHSGGANTSSGAPMR